MKYINLVFIFLIFCSTVCAAESLEKGTPAQGMRLHYSIISKYKSLDKFYKEPDLFGAITADPKITIYVPIESWNKLSEKEKTLLGTYAESLVSEAKENPLKYAKVPGDAPAATKIRINASKMNKTSWQIVGGKLINNNRDISSDSVLKSGK